MSSEVTLVVGEVLKNASLVTKAKDIAAANPIAAAVVGTVVLGAAVWGSYKLLSGFIGKPDKPVAPIPVTVVTPPTPTAES